MLFDDLLRRHLLVLIMRAFTSHDWFPLAVIGALLLLAGAIAPPLEILMGIAR
ncbi:hypothetical protein [Burkholderia singularis]|nr:hypothetical protein [Burkholderia singularis]